MFDLPGTSVSRTEVSTGADDDRLGKALADAERPFLDDLNQRNGRWFDAEIEKLDRWTGDRRDALKSELEELDDRLKELRKAARFAPSLPDKLEMQREAKRLESRRDEAWRAFDQASRELERQKDAMLDDIGRRLTARVERDTLFTIRWHLA